MALVIRRAAPSDFAALLAIENAAFDGDRLSPRALRRSLVAPSMLVVVGESAGSVVGYGLAHVRRGGSRARITSLAVAGAPKGSGQALLLALEAACRAKGLTGVRLEAREDNVRAIALYRRAGYRAVGRRENYYEDGAAAVRFEKALCDGPAAPVGAPG